MAQKNDYTEIIKDTAKLLYLAKRSGDADKKLVAQLYGIYYNAFAGALRTGVMYSKEMDVDGYPKYVITLGNTTYPCKDSALRDILGEDYEKLTKYPYSDTSASVVRHYEPEKREAVKDDYKESAKDMEDIVTPDGSRDEAMIRARNKALIRDARGFQYDPNYDHYYSDRLPEILKELDATKRTIFARIVCMSLSICGMAAVLIFL